MAVWQLYRQASQFREKPSTIFGIRDNAWLEFQFNNAVLLFGTWVQNRLDMVDDNHKRKYKTLAAALGEPTAAKQRPVNVGQLGMMPGVQLKD